MTKGALGPCVELPSAPSGAPAMPGGKAVTPEAKHTLPSSRGTTLKPSLAFKELFFSVPTAKKPGTAKPVHLYLSHR